MLQLRQLLQVQLQLLLPLFCRQIRYLMSGALMTHNANPTQSATLLETVTVFPLTLPMPQGNVYLSVSLPSFSYLIIIYMKLEIYRLEILAISYVNNEHAKL